jgi:hypothetical protein
MPRSILPKLLEKICTKRQKKSGQTTEKAPGRMRPERGKRDDYDPTKFEDWGKETLSAKINRYL